MFSHNIDPVIFSLGPFAVRWYGVFFALGFALVYFMLPYLARRKGIDLSKDDVADFIFYEIIGVVVGARIFYVFVYNGVYYLSNPLQAFAVWQGGLSFHGALVGAAVAAYFYCKKKSISFYALADLAVIPAALGLVFGRIANFINGELVGRVTSVGWCVNFKGYEGCRHPSQLYESLKNLVIFFSLWKLKDKELPEGVMFWSFVLMYSVLRFFIGFFRAPDSQLGFFIGLTMGQWLNVLMFIVGAYFIRSLYSQTASSD